MIDEAIRKAFSNTIYIFMKDCDLQDLNETFFQMLYDYVEYDDIEDKFSEIYDKKMTSLDRHLKL